MKNQEALTEIVALFKTWGVSENDYAIFGELGLWLQGFKVKVRKNHIDIVVVREKMPWKIKAGEEATVPPKKSKYFKSFLAFGKFTGCELHLIPLPLVDLSKKNLGKKTIWLELPKKEKIRVIKKSEQIKNYYYILARLAREDRWAEEKLKRWVNYFFEFSGLAKHDVNHEIVKWCKKGLKLSLTKKIEIDFLKNGARIGSLIHGRPIFRGIAKGRAVIIKKESDYKKIKKGDILVIRHAKPNIALALNKIAGLVTDEGGTMSHAAILSREQGIPCVIATKNATRILKNGDYIEVDARQGMVRLVRRAKAGNSKK